MAQQLTEIAAVIGEVDALLMGAHAVGMQDEHTAELRLARVMEMVVDASLRLTAVREALREMVGNVSGRLTA